MAAPSICWSINHCRKPRANVSMRSLPRPEKSDSCWKSFEIWILIIAVWSPVGYRETKSGGWDLNRWIQECPHRQPRCAKRPCCRCRLCCHSWNTKVSKAVSILPGSQCDSYTAQPRLYAGQSWWWRLDLRLFKVERSAWVQVLTHWHKEM